jgi:hypothetical protein
MPDQNIAYVLPEGWFVFTDSVKKPGLIAAFGNESRTKLIMILRDDENAATETMGPEFEKEYEKGLEKGGGGQRQWGKFVEIAGFPGYERLGRANVAGKETSVLNQVFIADGKHYSLQAMLVEGEDAGMDREIRDALGSFRFLTPPVAPKEVVSKEAAPEEAAPKEEVASKETSGIDRDSEAYRFGYSVGKVAVPLAVIAMIVGGIIVIVAIAQQSGRGSKRRSRRNAVDHDTPPVRPVTSRPPPPPAAPPAAPLAAPPVARPVVSPAARPPIKIIPRGGVKPRPQRPSNPPPPPPPSRPS